ncbi:MAG: SCO family protein [Bauldia litoralis]
MQSRKLAVSLLTASAALGFMLLLGWWQVDGPAAAPGQSRRPLPLTAMEFALIDHDENPVGPETLIGRPSLVFFGFTYCPDVCPTTLSNISAWLDGLGRDNAEQMNVVFVSIDPARDTAQSMANYVVHFHPSIRGWTGSAAEVARAADGFRVGYERVALEAGGYTMNHNASVFLFNASGRFVATIDQHETGEVALPKILRALTG